MTVKVAKDLGEVKNPLFAVTVKNTGFPRVRPVTVQESPVVVQLWTGVVDDDTVKLSCAAEVRWNEIAARPGATAVTFAFSGARLRSGKRTTEFTVVWPRYFVPRKLTDPVASRDT